VHDGGHLMPYAAAPRPRTEQPHRESSTFSTTQTQLQQNDTLSAR
jgi:hypothetical protein